MLYTIDMKNIYILEDVSSEGTKWFFVYKDPINGERIEIEEEDAIALRELK